jgi:hypothetical protein
MGSIPKMTLDLSNSNHRKSKVNCGKRAKDPFYQ